MHDLFDTFAHKTSRVVGSPGAFGLALLLVAGWLLTGRLLGFSDTWLQAIDTTTGIITFLMVFLIQNTQNRDAQAMNLKLDELVRATKKARNKVIDLEELSKDDLEKLQKEFRRLSVKKAKIT